MTDLEILRARVFELEEQLEAASIDIVAGVPTRSRLSQDLAKAWSAFERNPLQNMSILMLDIDMFKDVNDTYGHAAGDRALRAVATEIKNLARQHDLFGRWGGEEFVMCVRTDTTDGARAMAERLRARIASLKLGGVPRVTVSIGVYAVGDCPTLESAIKAADGAMYQAKRTGRNRVVVGRGPSA